jgi:DNA-binding MarR family transcriptional regulator
MGAMKVKRTPGRRVGGGRQPKSGSCGLAPGCRLHPHLTTYIGYSLFKVALRLRASFDRRIAIHGLVAPQYGMLVILKIEGAMTQNELGSYMAIDKASMVRLLDGLEDKGCLKRVQSKTDRRAKLVEITPMGHKMIGLIERQRVAAEREFLAPIDAGERDQLRRLIAKLIR